MSKPWLDSYPEGVPAEIDLSKYSSIPDIFEQSCAKFKDQTAYINFDTKMSFGELDKLTCQSAAWL